MHTKSIEFGFSKPGDIAFVRARGLIGTLIVWGQRALQRKEARFSHVMLCVSHGLWLHATPGRGVQLDAENTYLSPEKWSERFCTLEILRPPNRKPERPIAERPGYLLALTELNHDLTEMNKWNSAFQFFYGQRYNYTLGLTGLFVPSSSFCSELVCKAYDKQRPDILASSRSHKVYPADLYELTKHAGFCDVTNAIFNGSIALSIDERKEKIERVERFRNYYLGILDLNLANARNMISALMQSARVRAFQNKIQKGLQGESALPDVPIAEATFKDIEEKLSEILTVSWQLRAAVWRAHRDLRRVRKMNEMHLKLSK
jgi:hypothetical protein